jgi:hypothetical protein
MAANGAHGRVLVADHRRNGIQAHRVRSRRFGRRLRFQPLRIYEIEFKLHHFCLHASCGFNTLYLKDL